MMVEGKVVFPVHDVFDRGLRSWTTVVASNLAGPTSIQEALARDCRCVLETCTVLAQVLSVPAAAAVFDLTLPQSNHHSEH
jgi:hypothetical protein